MVSRLALSLVLCAVPVGCGSGADTGSGGSGPGTDTTGGSGVTGAGGDGADCTGATVERAETPDVVDQVAGVVVTTLAGSANAGDDDGVGAAAKFDNPTNVLLVAPETLYVSDFENGSLRRVTFGGAVTTVTHEEAFARPFGLALLPNGHIAVQTDYDAASEDAGPTGGVVWSVDPASGAATPIVMAAGRPRGMATLSNGLIVLSDILRHDVRVLDPGTTEVTLLAGGNACPAYRDGTGADARFNRPYGAVVTAAGDVLVADQLNHSIRRVSLAGVVSTVAGDGAPGMVDGDVSNARFDQPQGLAIDAAGNIYVSDVGNHRIRRIGANGKVQTLAGTGEAGFADGPGASAVFFGMEGLAVTPDGKTVFVADGTNGEINPHHRLRKISIP
jgi:hypothetical protein